MKRNRASYVVYFEPWEPGKHKRVTSKFQAKKLLRNAPNGSSFGKYRLIHDRQGGCSFWNYDHDYPEWVKK